MQQKGNSSLYSVFPLNPPWLFLLFPILPCDVHVSLLYVMLIFLFQAEGDGYDNRLNLNREQFCEALSLILNKGNKAEVSLLRR